MNSSLTLTSALNQNFPHYTPQVAKLMLELCDRKSIAHYGDNVWSNADKQTKACFNFVCGNHTRNLPVVRFNKVSLSQHSYPITYPGRLQPIPLLKAYDKWLYGELEEQMRLAKLASGGKARQDCSGVLFLRSLCRLTHVGYAQYYKGLSSIYPCGVYLCLCLSSFVPRDM
jgi:hypothetical protein